MKKFKISDYFNIKRVISFLLLLTLAAGFLPVSNVSASTQEMIKNLTIQKVGGSGNAYSVYLSWDPLSSPTINSADATSSPDYENYLNYGVSKYRIRYSNVTDTSTGELIADGPTPNLTGVTLQNLNLTSGSLYSFKVQPYHRHTTYVNGVAQEIDYTHANSSSQGEALLLTDLNVEAKGSGNTITFTWDAPTYNNRQIFDKYILYYKQGGSDARDTVEGSSSSITIPVSGEGGATKAAPDPLRPNVPRLTYTVVDSKIIVPGYFSVAVEPCLPNSITGTALRKVSSPTILVNTQIPITFSSYDNVIYGRSDAFVALPLGITVEGREKLKLFWPSLSSLGQVKSISIYKTSDYDRLDAELNKGEPSISPETTVFGSLSTSALVDRPTSGITYYGAIIRVEGKQPMRTEIVSYDASKVDIKPNRPDIHTPVEINSSKDGLSVTWDAFVREPFTEDEKLHEMSTGSALYKVDTNVYYDVWISDSMNNFALEGLEPTASFTPLSIGTPFFHLKEPNGQTVPAYQKVFNQYIYDGGSISGIQVNKLYYIKIIAKKESAFITSDGERYLQSEPAYYQVYISPEGDISTPPMISKPPLKIREDENGNQVITPYSIDIEWKEKWWEVYDEDSEKWHSKIALDEGVLYYGEDTKGHESKIVDISKATSSNNVREMLGLALDDSTPIRSMDISDCSYELKVIPFEEFLSEIKSDEDYINYLEQLIEEGSEAGWVEINPTKQSDKIYYTVPNLEPDTTYAILLRPYRVYKPENKKIAYPAYVVGKTSIINPVDPTTPTTPRLEGVGSTDVTVTVRWNYIEAFKYELIYSENNIQDIDKDYGSAIMISSDDIDENGTIKTENGQTYMYYTVTGLFPETGYYLWARALGDDLKGGYKYSSWSTSVYLVTDELKPPNPPDGLGLAPLEDVNRINTETGTDYKQKDKDYAIVSWMKDPADEIGIPATGGGGDTEILSHSQLLNSYIVKFNNLVSNRRYYARAKTILTVSKQNDGIVKSYYYLVQLSETTDFTDYVEIYVPSEPQAGSDPRYYRVKESVWCETVLLITDASKDDYDSEFDPDLVPLPETDFEIIYEGSTQTLTYRFRSSGKDENGNFDNRVDQRLISKLVSQGKFSYDVDLTDYDGKLIKTRVIEMPYTVMKAFEERKITLKTLANNLLLIMKPGILDTPQVDALSPYGEGSKLRITIEENPTDVPELLRNGNEQIQYYESTPQKVSMLLITPARTAELTYVGTPMDVKLKLNTRYEVFDKNVGGYYTGANIGEWTNANAQYWKEDAAFKFSTKLMATYASIATNGPKVLVQDNTTVSMLNVTSKLTITDLTTYNSNAPVTANNFNNVMYALMKGQKSVAMNGQLSAEQIGELSKAGLITVATGTSSVPREQAVQSIIRAYELKTGYKITGYPTLSTTMYSDIKDAGTMYQTAMLKGEFLGLYPVTTNLARPKANLNMGEMFQLADVVILDSGL